MLLALVSAPLVIHAQPVGISTAVTDANAAVPRQKYQSAYTDYKPSAESQSTPDKVWIDANKEVSGQSEHGSHAGTSMQMSPLLKESPKSAAAPAADPHKEHHMNMKGQ
ncbi:hypothetical protein CNX70_18540 [Janthinobacterium svalbardensis]|uniref:Uncharacterized protein n=2 Tax=Janthinobacterium svalbardensis TaxID=368607 RepID=A0A290WYH7_9BURK|nr:hypothetical protein CNX70_18540 [Janthinobacterium svalbardensis]